MTQRLPDPRVPVIHHQDRYSHRNDVDDDYTATSGHGKTGRAENATPRATTMPYIDQIFGNITSSGQGSVNRVGNHSGDFRAPVKTRTGDIVVSDGAKQSVGNTGAVDDGK
jgi:hypothetical protein